jgi:hypothetical protein
MGFEDHDDDDSHYFAILMSIRDYIKTRIKTLEVDSDYAHAGKLELVRVLEEIDSNGYYGD